jgi:chromosome segregation ATPase
MNGFFRILSAIGGWVSARFTWSSQSIEKATDDIYASSAEGIGRAFDLEQEKVSKDYTDLLEAVSGIEVILEERRDQLAELNRQEEELLVKRDNATDKFEQAEKAGDKDAMEKHEAAYQRFDQQIEAIEARQTEIESQITAQDAAMKVHVKTLTELQTELQNMPVEKANQIGDFVSNSKILELQQRAAGVRTSVKSGPIAAVRAKNKSLSAQVRVGKKVAGTDVKAQDDEYLTDGKKDVASSRMKQAIAARKARQSADTGEAVTQTEERPNL